MRFIALKTRMGITWGDLILEVLFYFDEVGGINKQGNAVVDLMQDIPNIWWKR